MTTKKWRPPPGRCAPTCPGFTVDWKTGAIDACKACPVVLVEDLDERGPVCDLERTARDFFRAFGRRPKALAGEPGCDDACNGWDVFTSGTRGLEIESCNDCCHGTSWQGRDDKAASFAWRTLWRWRVEQLIRGEYVDMDPGDFHGWAVPYGIELVNEILSLTGLRSVLSIELDSDGEHINGIGVRAGNGNRVWLPELCIDTENDGKLSRKAARKWAKLFVTEMAGHAKRRARAKARREALLFACRLVTDLSDKPMVRVEAEIRLTGALTAAGYRNVMDAMSEGPTRCARCGGGLYKPGLNDPNEVCETCCDP